MKIKSAASVLFLCLLLSGCASNRQAARRFREAKTANVVLQFSSWEYTFMLQPRYDDHGFLLQVPRDNVRQLMDRMNVRKRDLAVVVVGWNYNTEQLNQLVSDWKTILGGCGFQRVVVLKASGRKELNGSLIIDDTTLSGGYAQRVTRL